MVKQIKEIEGVIQRQIARVTGNSSKYYFKVWAKGKQKGSPFAYKEKK